MSLLIDVQKRFRVTIKTQNWSDTQKKYINDIKFDGYLTEDEAKELRRKLNYAITKKDKI